MKTVFKNLKMKNILWPLMITLLLSSIFSVALILPAKAAEGDPELFVEPQENIFDTDTMSIGDTFSFNVTVANITMLFGVQFKVYWNDTLLRCVDMIELLFSELTPAGEEDNIWRLKHIEAADHVEYAYTYLDSARAISGGYAPFNITIADGFPEGKQTVATIILEILAEPAPGENVNCVLDLRETKLGDPSATPIVHDVYDGYYELSAPPLPPPVLKVAPAVYQATHRNETFDVNVTIGGMDAGLQAVGVEYKLRYDPTILALESITEGPFMASFAGLPHQGTLFMTFTGTDYVQVGVVILPDENGTWHEPFPSGDGTIATITFKVAYGPAVSCDLELIDTKIGDWNAATIPHTTENGTFLFDVETLYHNVVVWSQPFVLVTVSNATIMPVPLVIPGPPNPEIQFNATGADGSLCFVNITIPKALIWLADPADEWLVHVDGAPVTPTVGENTTHTWLYFTFTTSEKPIQIWGTAIIPEFPSPILLLLALIAASAAALILTRRGKLKKFLTVEEI